MAIPRENLALEQFLKLPEAKPALEYENGRISQKASPQGQHSSIQGDLVELFNRSTRPNRLARAFPELRFTYDDRSYVPDVSVYLWDRIPRDERGRVANTFTEPPDIVVEIVSPDQSVTSLVRRCICYVARGVQVALLVDSADESILLFRPNQIPLAVEAADRIDLGDVIPGPAFTVADVFDALEIR